MLANAHELLTRTAALVLAPPERPPPDLWCDAHRVLPPKRSDRPGRWDTAVTPYFREPFRCAIDPECREITFMKSAQVGASEWAIGTLMYCLAVLSRSCNVLYDRQDAAIEFHTKRIMPAIEACRPFDGLRTGRAHDEKTTSLELKNATLSVRWANSAGGLRSDPVPVLVLDEFDLYPAGAADQARSRVTTYTQSLILKFSTPMFEGAGVDGEYAASDRRRFLIPCPHSGRYFEAYDWALIRWHGGTKADPEEVAATAWLQSPFVDGPAGRIYDHHKPAMLADGVWVKEGESIEGELEPADATGIGPRGPIGPLSLVDSDDLRAGPVRGVRIVGTPVVAGGRHAGFRMNSLISPWVPFGRLAREWVEAKGRPSPSWIRERLGQPYRARGARVEAEELRVLCRAVEDGGYRTRDVPPWLVAVVTAVDVQGDHVWVLHVGFGAMMQRVAVLGHERLDAPEGHDLVEIDGLSERSFRTIGGLMRPAVIGIDHGYRHDEVERFAVRRVPKRTVVCKGEGTADPSWNHRPGKSRSGRSLLVVNTNVVKDEVSALWSCGGGEAQRLYLPADCDEEVLSQLSAEERVEARPDGTRLMQRGTPIREWKMRPGRYHNHLFDCLVIALAAAESVGLHLVSEKTAVKAGQ